MIPSHRSAITSVKTFSPSRP